MNKTSIIRNIFDAKRIVVKIGSSLLVDAKTGLLRTTWLRALAQDIKRFRDRGPSAAQCDRHSGDHRTKEKEQYDADVIANTITRTATIYHHLYVRDNYN